MVNDTAPNNTCRTTKNTANKPIFSFKTPKAIITNFEHSYSTNHTFNDTFNKYFATVAQDIPAANTTNGKAAFINNNPLHYLFSAVNPSFPSIKLIFISGKEIEDITLSRQKTLMGMKIYR
jgi:hypothetical protein